MAHALHAQQKRKGCDTPYITHPMAVAALVGDYGGTEDQVIAALLHDAVEDQGGLDTLAQIRAQFGEAVADLVWACSDSHEAPKPPWRARKEAFLARIASLPVEARLVIAADKLHNARATCTDLRSAAPDFWTRFNGGHDNTLWYYAEAVRALSAEWTHPVLDELAEAVDRLHRLAEAARQRA